METSIKIPVISLAPSSVDAFNIFNPNDWSGMSKAIILSCSTALSVLHFEVKNISKICRFPKKLCKPHFENLKNSWGDSHSSLKKTKCYAQVPELHVIIKAFFSDLKGLLDLIVQLLPAENIVNARLDGFHRRDKKGVPVYGATVLNALSNNACADKKQTAKKIKELILSNKINWIDNVIQARDLLVHPLEGSHQIMFEIQLKSSGNTLIYKNATAPSIGSMSIDKFAKKQIENIEFFSKLFLKELRECKIST